MKSKLVIAFIMAATATLLFACAPSKHVQVSCNDFCKNNQITTEVQVA